MTVNSERQQHLAGDPQSVLFLDDLRDESADSLLQAVTKTSTSQFQPWELVPQLASITLEYIPHPDVVMANRFFIPAIIPVLLASSTIVAGIVFA